MPKPKLALIECDRLETFGCRYVAFSADGRQVFGFYYLKRENLGRAAWHASSGELEKSTAASNQHSVHGCAISDEGRCIAVDYWDRICIYDAASLSKLRDIQIGGSPAIGWHPDGTKLFIASGLRVTSWPVVGSDKVDEVELKARQECDNTTFVSFSLDGTKAVLGRNSGIETWNFHTGEVERVVRFSTKDGHFWQHGLSPNKSIMLSLSDQGCLLQTDTKTWTPRRFTIVRNDYGSNFVFSPDGKLAACRTGNRTVFVWDVIAAQPWLKWSKPHWGNLGNIAFAPDSKRLACTLDFQVFILDFRLVATARSVAAASIETGKHRCVEMVGGDDRMDLRGGNMEPLNPLPQKCAVCRMPDLDFVAEPYLIGRGIEKPVDMAIAEAGNFLVRESVKRILEVAATGQCRFISTVHHKTKAPSAWFLAVPQNQEITASPPANRERCPQCGEPWCFHHYSESSENWQSPDATHEVFKSKNWGCHKHPFQGWDKDRPEIFGRMLYFSVRLETLLKKLKVRGLVRSYGCRDLLTAADAEWVKRQLQLLNSTGSKDSQPTQAEGIETWFASYLQKHTKAKPKPCDYAAIERRERVCLPAAYKEFAAKIGQKKFNDFNGDEGHELVVLLPRKLDFDTFKNFAESGEGDAPKRAVIFGETNSGDALIFDLAGDNPNPEVLYYDHETDEFEPFAKSFADCIKQLAGL